MPKNRSSASAEQNTNIKSYQMNRDKLTKKVENIFGTHIKTFELNRTTTGLINDLVDLYISSIKKQVNIALHKQKKELEGGEYK